MKLHINISLEEFNAEGSLEFLAGEGLKPELYLSGPELEALSTENISRMRERLDSFGLFPITLHAPFHDLNPGATDGDIRDLSLRKISKAISLGSEMPVLGIVVHSGYNDWYYDFDVSKWLSVAVPSFSSLAEEAAMVGTKVFVENIFERNPDNLLELKRKVGHEGLLFCFDPGHGHLFSDLSLVSWYQSLSPYLGEIHLHDNCGKRDDHLPLLEGCINFQEIIGEIFEGEGDPVFTLEPHTYEHAVRTLENFRKICREISGGTSKGVS